MRVWEEPLDQTGDHTYQLDFTKEMTALGSTLSTCTFAFSTAAALVLEQHSNVLVLDVAFVKFRLQAGFENTFTQKGKPLEIKVTYSSAAGDSDAFTVGLHIKNK